MCSEAIYLPLKQYMERSTFGRKNIYGSRPLEGIFPKATRQKNVSGLQDSGKSRLMYRGWSGSSILLVVVKLRISTVKRMNIFGDPTLKIWQTFIVHITSGASIVFFLNRGKRNRIYIY